MLLHSTNIKKEILNLANKLHISILCLQETGVTHHALPSTTNFCQRHGWQFVGAPASSVQGGGRGGVAFLVKEPLALTHLHTTCDTWGQVLSCELLGHHLPLTLIVGYRRPGDNVIEPNNCLMTHFQKSQSRNWIFACDWNCNPLNGPLPEFLSHFDAQLGNTSGHLNSTTPTDSIWLAPSLSILDSGSIPVISDHTGAFVSLEKTRKSGVEPQSLEFQKHATPVSSQLPSTPNVEIWRQVATTDLEWTQVLEDPDRAWQLW